LRAFRDGMHALGWEEGAITFERLPVIARELVAAKVDLIPTGPNEGARAAKGATSGIPL
jgi:hypothetical protein